MIECAPMEQSDIQAAIVEAAPMAGYTTPEFRRVLANLGAKVLWTEMVSAAALHYGNAKTMKLIACEKKDGVKNVVQLFGHNPVHFVSALKNSALESFDEVNINMGCPANKVMKNGDGVGLMNNPDLAREIIETCVRISNKPISVKMRLGVKAGYDYVAFAKMCEVAGARRLIVHGRYGEQGYSGTADWSAIAEIVKAVNIPVIANGDIRTPDDIKRCLEITNASGVMIGRALLPLYKKYFRQNIQILRGDQICRKSGIDTCCSNIGKLFMLTRECDTDDGGPEIHS